MKDSKSKKPFLLKKDPSKVDSIQVHDDLNLTEMSHSSYGGSSGQKSKKSFKNVERATFVRKSTLHPSPMSKDLNCASLIRSCNE